MKIRIMITLAILSFLSACAVGNGIESPNSVELGQEWGRSYEDEEGLDENHWVFRSNVRDLPPARYREKFILGENNTLQWWVLAGNDAHYYDEGSYAFDQEGRLLSIQTPGGGALKWEVLSLTDDMLVVKVE